MDLFIIIVGATVMRKAEVHHMIWLVGHIIVLFAEYAATITTIPPLETKKKEKASGQYAEAGR